MNARTIGRVAATAVIALSGLLFGAEGLSAHCDGLDGPVVTAGAQALETGNVNHALAWVLPDDEDEVRRAFEHALAVRSMGEEARKLADRFFYETLVRVHRAGEGEPYTGLKPAGRDLGPAIPAADLALETGSAEALDEILVHLVRDGLRERFAAAHSAAGYAPGDVEAGRAFVEAYVPFIHFVEEIWRTASGHGHEAGAATGAAPHPD